MFSELLATRDAARNERDALRARLETADERDEEIRILRAELAALRPSTEQLDSRLRQTRTELDTARESLRRLRRRSGARWRGQG
jgi:chromosome segregation ATPase